MQIFPAIIPGQPQRNTKLISQMHWRGGRLQRTALCLTACIWTECAGDGFQHVTIMTKRKRKHWRRACCSLHLLEIHRGLSAAVLQRMEERHQPWDQMTSLLHGFMVYGVIWKQVSRIKRKEERSLVRWWKWRMSI